MSKAVLHPSLRELSGAMGEMVFRTRNGKTSLCMRPHSNAEPSQAQMSQRANFKKAVSYAKSVLANPTLRAIYAPIAAERELSIFALAVADYLNAPYFESMDLSKYKGQVGDLITITGSDDIGMATVDVKITSQTGTLIERGQAVENGARSGIWTYTATAAVALGTSIFIEVKGTDHANNTATYSDNPTVGQTE
jgi:hypothetical protein